MEIIILNYLLELVFYYLLKLQTVFNEIAEFKAYIIAITFNFSSVMEIYLLFYMLL